MRPPLPWARPSVPPDPGGGEDVPGLRPLLDVILVELRGLREQVADRRKPLLTVDEVARLVGRDPYTIRSWIKAGRLDATRVQGTGPKGRLLIPRDALDRLVGNAAGSRSIDGTPAPKPMAGSGC